MNLIPLFLTCFFVSSVVTKPIHRQQQQHHLKHDLNATYDPTLGLHNLYFAYGAYCSEDKLESWTCKWCEYIPDFEVSDVYVKDKLQVYAGYDKSNSQIVVSFRGSVNALDWIDDFDIIQTDYPWVEGGKVHDGFYIAWGEVSKEVMSITTQLMTKYSDTTVLVTGHSLGASLAQYAAANFSRYASENNLKNSVITYTYGSPRWANEAVADYYATIIDLNWRFVNVHDIVPTIPSVDDGYHHTWTEVHYTSDSPLEYQVCDGSGEDADCSYLIPSADDHLMYFDLYETCA